MLTVSNHIEPEMSVLTVQADRLETGEKIKAELIKNNNGKSTFKITEPQSSSFVFETPEVPAQIGEVIEFQVEKSEKYMGKNKLTLKPILSDTDDTKQVQPPRLPEMALKQISIKITEENLNAAKTLLENNMDVQKEAVKALAEIKKNVSYVVNNVTEDKIQLLQENGFNVEKITLNLLCSAMKELNTNILKPEISDQELKSIVDKYIKSEKISEKDLTQKAEKIEKLCAAGIPATEKNIQSLEAVQAKYESITESQLKEPAIAQLLQQEKDLTLSNVYIAKHTGGPTQAPTQDTLKELEAQIRQFLDREGIAITAATLDISKFLIKNDIPLTKENIEKTTQLRELKRHIQLEYIYNCAIENIKHDNEIADIPIFQGELEIELISKQDIKTLDKKYAQIIEDLPKITDAHIKSAILQDKPITIGGLRKDLDEYDLKPKERTSPILGDSVLDAEAIKIKRQLAEIQLKLTKESVMRLAGKGIDIDTQPLEQAIDTLKQVEKEIYQSNLRMTDTPATEENIAKMERIYDQVNKLLPTTYTAYHEIIQNKAEFTIDTVANTNSAAIAKMLDDFETFATAPTSKYGDSFRTTLNREIEGVLENLNIDTTDQNIKAAKILSKTEIDITEGNLTEVKIIDTKIEAIADRLHPAIAASMVKEGLNPTEMHVDEVLSYIDKFNNVYGDNLSDKIAKFILQMDDNKTLSPKERESMIAVYRLLNLAKRDESVAIGIALKSESQLTLGNLMEASKYYGRTAARREDVNIQIDDNFGTLEKLETPQNNIRQILSGVQSFSQGEEEVAITALGSDNTAQTSAENNMGSMSESSANISPQINSGNMSESSANISPEINSGNMSESNANISPEINSGNMSESSANISPQINMDTMSEPNANISPQINMDTMSESNANISPQISSGNMSELGANISPQINMGNTRESISDSVAQILSENNMGSTGENIQKVLQILENTPPEIQLNNEFIKKILHETMVLEQFANEATPEKLQKAIQDVIEGKEPQMLYKLATDFKKEINLKNDALERRQLIEYTKKLQELADTSQQSVKFMAKNSIPMTLTSILAMQALSSDPFAISGQLSKLKKDKEKIEDTHKIDENSAIEDLFGSIDSVELESVKNSASHNEALDNLYRKLEDVKTVAESREVLEQVKMIQSVTMIQKYSSCMKIPVRIAQDVSDLNIYVINNIEGKQDIKAVMALKTDGLGMLKIDINILYDNVSLSISTASDEVAELLKDNQEHLQLLMRDSGYNLKNVSYGTGEDAISSIFNEDALPEYPAMKSDFYGVVSDILKYVEISTN